MSVGLERTDTEPEVGVDVGTVVIFEGIVGAAEGGLAVTAHASDAVTEALDSPAAEIREGLQEVEVCRFKLLADSNLAGGRWDKSTGVGGLWVTGGGLAGAGGGVATGLGLSTEGIIFGGSEASLLTVEVRIGLTEGALTTVAGVFGGAVVVAEVELSVDLIVIEGEDIIGDERLVIVTGIVEGFPAVGVGVDLIVKLVAGSDVGVESELSLTE